SSPQLSPLHDGHKGGGPPLWGTPRVVDKSRGCGGARARGTRATRRKGVDAAARCGGVDWRLPYEMPAAVQAAAPALLHRAVLSMNWSLMTVSFMFLMLTHTGTSSDAGCVFPLTPDGGEV